MEMYWYCGVKVKGIGTVYSYISDDGEIPVGSYVEVPFGQKNTPVIGCVETGDEYTEENAPYPVAKTKHIIRIATAQEYVEQASIPSYYDDEDEFDDIDYYIEIEDWDEVLEWACENHDCPYEHIGKKVIECYELCIEQEMPVAALNLGTFYYNGKFVERDFKKAFELYKIAADAGEIRAICNCGYCFYYGRHQEIDYTKAFEYFSLGALLFNDANCLYKLGDMYLNGYGIYKNKKYAFLLYERALKCCQENEKDGECTADAQFRVGKCLLKGIGAKVDVEEAHVLLTFALLNFYKRRKNDNFVAGLIESTKKFIAEAQEKLDKETSNYQYDEA